MGFLSNLDKAFGSIQKVNKIMYRFVWPKKLSFPKKIWKKIGRMAMSPAIRSTLRQNISKFLFADIFISCRDAVGVAGGTEPLPGPGDGL